MRIACFDCFAGASGNMILGALVDAGLSIDALQRELRRLPVDGWTMHAETVRKRGIGALYLDVDVPGEDHDHGRASLAVMGRRAMAPLQEHRKLGDVLAIVRAAGFPAAVEKAASAIYHRLGEAEARAHRVPVDDIAFHEVGQIDAIVDIAGAALGLFMLDIERVYCSRLPCGRGNDPFSARRHAVPAAGYHGASSRLPVLRRRRRRRARHADRRRHTDDRRAVRAAPADDGARHRLRQRPLGFPFANVLRVVIGDVVADDSASAALGANGAGEIEQIETNIDDMNPQIYEHLFEQLFAAGAVDVWASPAQMKKGRPGTIVSVLAPLERADAVTAALLAETTTIGVRRWTARRTIGMRTEENIDSEMGSFRVKITQTPAGPRARPEYEDVRAMARRDGAALVDVMRRAEHIADEWLCWKTAPMIDSLRETQCERSSARSAARSSRIPAASTAPSCLRSQSKNWVKARSASRASRHLWRSARQRPPPRRHAPLGLATRTSPPPSSTTRRYRANPVNRCYFCKNELYGKLVEIARERGFACVVDGFNADDGTAPLDTRPGRGACDAA